MSLKNPQKFGQVGKPVLRQIELSPTGNPPERAAVAIRAAPVALSVVIPVFNERDTLRLVHARVKEAVEAAQPEHEIIFVNDGSTDESGAILDELASGDPRV